jgi:hypothetical protein
VSVIGNKHPAAEQTVIADLNLMGRSDVDPVAHPDFVADEDLRGEDLIAITGNSIEPKSPASVEIKADFDVCSSADSRISTDSQPFSTQAAGQDSTADSPSELLGHLAGEEVPSILGYKLADFLQLRSHG